MFEYFCQHFSYIKGKSAMEVLSNRIGKRFSVLSVETQSVICYLLYCQIYATTRCNIEI